MENRLALCLQQLKEVEAKLIELQETLSGNSAQEDFRVAEALSFVQQASKAVLESRRVVANLPPSNTRMPATG